MDRARLARLAGRASLVMFGVAVVTFFFLMFNGPRLGEQGVKPFGTLMYVGWGGGIALGAVALVLFLVTPRAQKKEARIALAPIVVFVGLLAGFALLVYLIFSGMGNI